MILSTAYLCMALNVYFESRGEPDLGQKLVAQATINRTGGNIGRICDVVLQPRQFEWTRKHVSGKRLKPSSRPALGTTWMASQSVADDALNGNLDLHKKWHNVTHFHNTSVKPSWTRSKDMQYLGRVGNHIFYHDKSISQR